MHEMIPDVPVGMETVEILVLRVGREEIILNIWIIVTKATSL